MVREILIPTNSDITLSLPPEMVGKTVEVIAFEISPVKSKLNRSERLEKIEALTKNKLVDLSNFKFSRDEADNYDE